MHPFCLHPTTPALVVFSSPGEPPQHQRCRRIRTCASALAADEAESSALTISGGKRLPMVGTKVAQRAVLQAISGVKGRGKSGLSESQLEALNKAVEVLEKDGGVKAPTRSPLLKGKWRLLFTTRPGTASPIQRTFTGVESFSVFQEILFDDPQGARVNNIVDFGERIGELKVEAEANTDSQPLPGFTPRKGAGLALFGKSSTYPPTARDMRIDFQFDRAAFTFRFLPFKVPYPVPFKLLGDETKGWIDITYLSPDGTFRLTRGNKGTLFVLARERSVLEKIQQAVTSGDDELIQSLISELQQKGGVRSPALSQQVEGKWRLLWTVQASNANFLQKALASRVRNYQIVEDEAGPGRLENLVSFAPFLRLRAGADCEPSSADRTSVAIDSIQIELGSLRIPLPLNLIRGNQPPGYVDWLYLDDEVRITRGSKGSLFIHVKES